MKTLYLLIIIGIGMAFLVIENFPISFAQDVITGGARTYHIMDTPLKQFKLGIPAYQIVCKDGSYLALKSHNQDPTCLKAGTISKLASRGFLYGITANESETNYSTILIPPGSENPSLNKTYNPSMITVVLGVNNTVRWANQAEVANTIVSDMPLIQNGKSFDSNGVIKPGQSYRFTFTEPGTFTYHTEPHPWMKGSIIVVSNLTSVTNPNSTKLPIQNPFLADKNGKIDLSKINLPPDQHGNIDYTKIGYLVSDNEFKKILHQLSIGYSDSNYLLIEGFELTSYPPFSSYCGYALDNNQQEHWFSSSFHYDTLTSHTISKSNPEPCKPGFESCSCNLQTKIAENNLKQLSYFSKSEEESVGKEISEYLDKTKIANVSNQFVVGKYNLESNFADIHFCGSFTNGAGLKDFEGYVTNGKVVYFSLASEKPKLCTISNNAQIFTFDKSSIVQ